MTCKTNKITGKIVRFAGTILLLSATAVAPGQIGGQTAAGGPFVVDDFEDLDIQSDTLLRTWLASVIVTVPTDLELSGSGLTLAPGQTPNGAFKLTFPDDNAIIGGQPNSAFGDIGIPLPGVAGQSTDPNAGGTAGNITSFANVEFVQCYELSGALTNTAVEADLLIECYPQNMDGSFPTLTYSFTPTEGTTFDSVQLDLRTPTSIVDNQASLTVEDLLSQVRFLDLFFIASPVGEPAFFDVRVDDVTFSGMKAFADPSWEMYQ